MTFSSFDSTAGGVRADDMAVVEQIAAVGYGEALLGILLDQKNADAGFLDAGERAEQLGAKQRRKTERRLVEQEDGWRRHHRPPDRHHLALAAAHGAHNLLRSAA